MLTVRPSVTYSGNIFGFYAESADTKLAVHVMETGVVTLYYEDATRDFDQPFKHYPTFSINVTDGRYTFVNCIPVIIYIQFCSFENFPTFNKSECPEKHSLTEMGHDGMGHK